MVGKAGNCESMGLRDAFYRSTAEKLQKTAQKAPPDSAGGEAGVVVARRGVSTSGQGRSAGGGSEGISREVAEWRGRREGRSVAGKVRECSIRGPRAHLLGQACSQHAGARYTRPKAGRGGGRFRNAAERRASLPAARRPASLWCVGRLPAPRVAFPAGHRGRTVRDEHKKIRKGFP